MKKLITSLIVLMLVFSYGELFLLLPFVEAHSFKKTPGLKPIIFVHGGAGSAAQFESQAMRFASNGYPANLIYAFEYDSSMTINTMEDIYNNLDQTIAIILKETGAEQVYILGHSYGTTVMHGYLSSPARAAKVARYVNIDGRTAPALPGGVPTLALWAGMGWSAIPGREIGGATNVLLPKQTHIEAATSAEAFVEIYKFFTGKNPFTSEILPEYAGFLRLAGRAIIFPLNKGVENAALEIWELNACTGARNHKKPNATYYLDADGAWGPFKARPGGSYEFVLLREGMEPHHFYFQPFMRSNHLMRLLASNPSFGRISSNIDRIENHSALTIIRNKEFWGDQGVNNDILAINGVNLITPTICPVIKGQYRTGVIGLFAFDKNKDGLSDLLNPIMPFYSTSFMSGVDLFIPAVDPPNATISIVLMNRGGCGAMQIINIPNWTSSGHRVTIQFNDFVESRCEQTWSAYPAPGFNWPCWW